MTKAEAMAELIKNTEGTDYRFVSNIIEASDDSGHIVLFDLMHVEYKDLSGKQQAVSIYFSDGAQ